MTNKTFTILILLLTATFAVSAQTGNVGIGTSSPAPTARLEVNDTARGLLIPRMTKTQRLNILNPANGLLVYQNNDTIGTWEYLLDHWERLITRDRVGSGGAIIPLASGLPVTMTTVLGGAVGTAATLGFGTGLASASLAGNTIDLTGGAGTALNFAFSVPRAGTLTAISAYFSTTAALSIATGSVTINAQLYHSTAPNNMFTPVNGALVQLAPALSGTSISIGTTASGITATELNVAVNPQERYLLVFSTSVSGITLATAVAGYVSAGINIE